MFDTDALVVACHEALKEPDPQRAVRELLIGTLENPGPVAEALGKDLGGLETIFSSPELTILNVIWAPGMALYPHDHRMWAVIGIYGGIEDNTMYRRGPERIVPAGGRQIAESDVLALGADAIHAVANPERRFTGAIPSTAATSSTSRAANGIRTRSSNSPTTSTRCAGFSRPPTRPGHSSSVRTWTRPSRERGVGAAERGAEAARSAVSVCCLAYGVHAPATTANAQA